MIRVYTFVNKYKDTKTYGVGSAANPIVLRQTTTPWKRVVDRGPFDTVNWHEYNDKWRLTLIKRFCNFVIQCDTLEEKSFVDSYLKESA